MEDFPYGTSYRQKYRFTAQIGKAYCYYLLCPLSKQLKSWLSILERSNEYLSTAECLSNVRPMHVTLELFPYISQNPQ